MLNRNVEKEAVNVLLQENRRLKRENQRIRSLWMRLRRIKMFRNKIQFDYSKKSGDML